MSHRPHAPEHAVPARAATPALTRRTVVRVGAAAGAAVVLGAAGPGEAVAAAGPGRLVVRRSALSPGGTTGPLRAPHRFDLLGAPVRAVAGVGLQVRARTRGGRWSGWRSLSGHDGHAPDGRRAAMTDPLWFGDVDEVELRARRRPDRDVRLDLVAVPSREKHGAQVATIRAAGAGGVLAAGRATTRSGGGTRPGTQATTRSVPTIIPRAAWASGLTPRSGPSLGSVQVAFVHHTVNGNAYAPTESAGIVRAIYEYHVNSNGWNDIGYNFLVDRFGQIFEGRAGGVDQPVVGAQAVGWNSVSTGIAIIGTFEGEPAPPAALDAVAALVRWKLPLHGAPTAGTVALVSSGGAGNRWKAGTTVQMERVSGHRDGCSTDCPGTSLYGQLPALRSAVGSVGGVPVPELTIEGPPEATTYGATATVRGRLTTAGSGVAGSTVVVEKKSPKGAWVPMAQTTTAADGTWSAGIVVRAASAIRATANGVTSPLVTPGLDPDLVVERPAKYPRPGTELAVRGSARGVDRVSIVLRRKQGGRYITASRRAATVRRGRFSGRVPVRRSALHSVRVEATSGGRVYRSVQYGVRAKG